MKAIVLSAALSSAFTSSIAACDFERQEGFRKEKIAAAVERAASATDAKLNVAAFKAELAADLVEGRKRFEASHPR